MYYSLLENSFKDFSEHWLRLENVTRCIKDISVIFQVLRSILLQSKEAKSALKSSNVKVLTGGYGGSIEITSNGKKINVPKYVIDFLNKEKDGQD